MKYHSARAMKTFVWICLGSAAGGGARYLLASWTVKTFGPAFPYGTLAVNVVGSFLVAIVMYAGAERALISPTVRLALSVGVMGGFTTYSTFSYETIRQLEAGAWGIAAAYVVVTTVACLFACGLGWLFAKWLLGP